LTNNQPKIESPNRINIGAIQDSYFCQNTKNNGDGKKKLRSYNKKKQEKALETFI